MYFYLNNLSAGVRVAYVLQQFDVVWKQNISASLLQLINELGTVDARLAPQLRQLLSGDQQDRTVKRSVGSKRVKIDVSTL